MTFKTFLKATTAAALVSMAGASWAATHPETGEELAETQEYTYRLLDDIKSFDPQINTDAEGSMVLRDLFEGLVNSAPDGSSEPGVAESWDVSEDGLTYTFHLRDDAVWTNGDPVTAGDFVYAWRRLADPATASQYASYMELMGVENAAAITKGEMEPDTLGVTAQDDHTLVVKIDAKRRYFIGMLTHPTTFPVNQAVVEEFGDKWTAIENIVGNGAYKLTEYQPGVQVVRVRNDAYWNNDETILDKVTALVVNDENIALTRYDAGELDRTETPSGQYPAQEAARPEESHSFPYSCSYIYMYNVGPNGPEYLKDVRVRQALSYAINRDVIVDNVLQGGQYPSYNWTHQAIAGFTMPEIPYAEWTQQERNEKARELLAEAGYGPDNPLDVTVNYNTAEGHKKIAIAVSQMWKQTLGINATLNNYEWKVHTDQMQAGDFEIGRYAWCGDYNEPSTYTDFFYSTSGHNNGKYDSAEYDALVDEAKTVDDPSALYTEMEHLLAEDMPFAPIYQYTRVMMLKPDIKGWPFGDLLQNVYSRELYRVAQ